MPEGQLCAYCRRRPVDAKWRPFCSERCKMADLGHWISGDYRVPGAERLEDELPEGLDDDPNRS